MGEGLREVAERGARGRVDLLGEEPDVVGVGEQALEAPLGRLDVAALASISTAQKPQMPNAPSAVGRPSVLAA